MSDRAEPEAADREAAEPEAGTSGRPEAGQSWAEVDRESAEPRLSRRSVRVILAVNGLILSLLAAWLLEPAATAPPPEARSGPEAVRPDLRVEPRQPPPTASPTAGPSPEPSLTRQDVLDIPGLRFGLSAPDVPWSTRESTRLAEAAQAAPTLIQFFVHWTQDYPAETVELCYGRGAVPVLSWEPWEGIAHGTDQPDYALSRIAGGEFDEYLREFAGAVRDHGWPVVIRFAHEMNGTWFPWSEQNSGNRRGEFVPAWRHVHDIFAEVGATNVIWLWSPNILRPVPEVSLAALYPGDDYVDWAGMVGYAVEESTAAAVYAPTRDALREFTDKPLVITETGAQPGPGKAAWIEDFFAWLAGHPDVIGFIWFEYAPGEGGNADWRFTETAATTEAFRNGIARAELAPPPAGGSE